MPRSFFFYIGLALVTGAVLMFQIIETRILSVISWYYLSFFVISMAMFGLTAGAVYVYLKSDTFASVGLSTNLTNYGTLFAISTPVSLLVQLNVPIVMIQGGHPGLIAATVFLWTIVVVAVAVPFFFAGVVVSLALTRSPFPIGRVYGVDLLGAAAGSLGAVCLLNLTDGPSSVLWVSASSALAAWCFSHARIGEDRVAMSPLRSLLNRPRTITAILIAAAAFNSATDWGIKPNYLKGESIAQLRTPIYQGWNSYSYVMQVGLPAGEPHLWGPSPRFPSENWTVDQRVLVIDGDAGTTSYGIHGDVAKADFLKFDVTNLAYYLPDRDSAAIIGVGGGRDILSAKLFDVETVTGVELNPLILKLLTQEGGFGNFVGISELDGVALHVDEARSWFARSSDSYDLIQMSLIDTWAATGAGAYTLSENGLYTTEAWRLLLDHLTPRGVFTVSRWYSPGEVDETGRMTSLAVAALIAGGATEPAKHIFLAAAGPVATLIVSRSPLPPSYVATLAKVAEDLDFRILLSPDRTPASEIAASIVASNTDEALARATSGLKLDLAPPTDDRPFFFNQLPLNDLRALLDTNISIVTQGVVQGNLRATATILVLVGISLILVIGTIVIPLRPAVRDVGRRLAWSGTAYFFLIGAGFIFFEIALMQRMSVFLGHPTYSLSIVLFSMILSAGIGSLLSDRFMVTSSMRFLAWAVTTGCYLLSLTVWLTPLLTATEIGPLLVRGIIAVAAIFPAGILLGFGFPTGMRLISAVDTRPTPWFWGINGAAGVLSSSLAVLCSTAYGISVSVIVAAVCYFLLVPAAFTIGFPRFLKGGEPAGIETVS